MTLSCLHKSSKLELMDERCTVRDEAEGRPPSLMPPSLGRLTITTLDLNSICSPYQKVRFNPSAPNSTTPSSATAESPTRFISRWSWREPCVPQRIFQTPFSWRSMGVEVRGGSRSLRENYRTPHQIRMQADRLLRPSVTDVDGKAEDRSDTVSVFNGPPPTRRTLARLKKVRPSRTGLSGTPRQA